MTTRPATTTPGTTRDEGALPSPWRRALGRLLHRPVAVVCLVILAGYVLAALVPGWLAPYDPLLADGDVALVPPGGDYWLGTDPIGRDVLSRIVYSARPALIVGLAVIAIGVLIGALSGLAAGFYDNRVTNAAMRVWDGVFAVPAVLIGLILAATFGQGTTTVVIAVGVAAAPALARVSRASSLGESRREYVEAAKVLGFARRRIFLRHVVPNSLSPVIVQIALVMGFAILLESALAFLGVSTQPPAPSWGGMLSDSRDYLDRAWWYGLYPGLAISILVLAVNLLADAARDAFDPHTDKGR